MALRLVPASGTPIDVPRDQVVVGREPSCDIVLSDGSVSRKHARLEKNGEQWKVVDNGSANGTYVDGQRIAEMILRKGMDLRFGAVAFKVDLDEPQEEMAETIVGAAPFVEQEATVLTPAVAPPAPPRAPAPPPRAANADITEQAPRPRIDADPVTAYVPPAERTATPPQPSPAIPAPPPVPAPPRAVPPMPPPPAAAPPAPPPPRPAAPPPPPPARAGGPPPPPPPPPGRPGMPPAPPPMAGRPPAGGPPPVGAAAPAKKKGPLFWGVIACCGCLLLVMLVAGLGGAAAWFATSKPVEATRAMLTDAKGGNVDAAYAKTSSGFQQRVSKESFAAFVAQHPGIATYTDSTFPVRNVNNNRATVTGMLTAAGGTSEAAVFELVQEGGEWKVDAITVNGESPGTGPVGSGFPTDPQPADQTADGSGLTLETTGVDKQPADGGVKVTVTIRATGFATRQQGEAYMIHLVEDLETFAPGGARIDGLSKEQIQAINKQVEDPAGLSQEFVTDITLLEPPDGDYRARITIRDIIGGSAQTEEVTFSLP